MNIEQVSFCLNECRGRFLFRNGRRYGGDVICDPLVVR